MKKPTKQWVFWWSKTTENRTVRAEMVVSVGGKCGGESLVGRGDGASGADAVAVVAGALPVKCLNWRVKWLCEETKRERNEDALMPDGSGVRSKNRLKGMAETIPLSYSEYGNDV